MGSGGNMSFGNSSNLSFPCGLPPTFSPTLNIPPAINYIQACIALILGATGFSLNLFILVMIVKYKTLHLRLMYLALHIIGIDLIYTLTIPPVIFISGVSGEWFFGDVVCNILGMIHDFFAMFRFTMTLILALDRFISVFWPFFYFRNSLKLIVVLLVAVWVVSLLRAVLPMEGVFSCFLYVHTQKTCTAFSGCSDECFYLVVSSSLVIVSFGMIFPLLLYVVLFCKTRTIRRRSKSVVGSIMSSVVTTSLALTSDLSVSPSINRRQGLPYGGKISPRSLLTSEGDEEEEGVSGVVVMKTRGLDTNSDCSGNSGDREEGEERRGEEEVGGEGGREGGGEGERRGEEEGGGKERRGEEQVVGEVEEARELDANSNCSSNDSSINNPSEELGVDINIGTKKRVSICVMGTCTDSEDTHTATTTHDHDREPASSDTPEEMPSSLNHVKESPDHLMVPTFNRKKLPPPLLLTNDSHLDTSGPYLTSSLRRPSDTETQILEIEFGSSSRAHSPRPSTTMILPAVTSRKSNASEVKFGSSSVRTSITMFILLMSVIGCTTPAFTLYGIQFLYLTPQRVLFIVNMMVGRTFFNLLPVIDSFAIMRHREFRLAIKSCLQSLKKRLSW